MKESRHVDIYIMLFVFMLLFTMPVIFTRIGDEISWRHVYKIWFDQAFLIPVFLLNHWILAPKFILKQKYFIYLLTLLFTLIVTSFLFNYFDSEIFGKKKAFGIQPNPIPPYANLLMYSLLVVGLDTGLLFSKRWHQNENKKQHLEKENIKMQLDILRNQVSPHFFMNTLNNIYAMVDIDSQMAKESIIKLSKLMRYLLYENENGRVKISKEFEFIKSYIDLMKLRSDENVSIQLIFPEKYTDFTIPALLFISYIENAFKYGLSYQNVSFINIIFELSPDKLHFTCINSQNTTRTYQKTGGLGLLNTEARLRLLFGDNYILNINTTEKIYNVSLTIPLT